MMKRAMTMIIALCMLAGMLPLTGCSGNEPMKDAATKADVKEGTDTKIGSRTGTGWEMTIPDGVMEDGTEVNMKVLSGDEAENYQTSGFTFYGTPVEVSGEGAHGIWFAKPVPVTMQIPQEYLADLAAEELFFATCEDGAWWYYLPDNVNLQDGTAMFSASHFSILGFGRPSEEEQLQTFARTYAVNEYERRQKKEKFRNAVSGKLDELFKSMGVDSTNARNQLIQDAVTYLESGVSAQLLEADNPIKDFAPVDTLMRLAVAAEKGDQGKNEFNSKATELYAKAIAYGVEKHVNANKTLYGIKDAQTGYVDKTAKAITVLGNLGTAAGAFVEGDTKGGLQAVGNMVTGLAGPQAALITATLTYAKDGIQEAGDSIRASWTQSEIEEAYRLYTKSGGAFEGDFDGIFALKGNAEALMNQRIIQAHCTKYGISEADLTATARKTLLNNAWTGLRNYFDRRKEAEPAIERLRQDEEAFIAQMKNRGLLAAHNYKDYFGIDKNSSNYSIEERLRRLYTVRDGVLGCIDADKRGTLGNERLARAMEQWIYWNEKGRRDKFYEYLRETGLYEESFAAEPSPEEETAVPEASPLQEEAVTKPSSPEEAAAPKSSAGHGAAPEPSPAADPATPAPEAEPAVPVFAWVLTQVIDEDGAESIRERNKNYAGVYEYTSSYARSDFSITTTYVGRTDTYPDPDKLHGESAAFHASFSKPPETIQAGDPISIKLSLSAGDMNLSFFTFSGNVRSRFRKSGSGWQNFADGQGNYSFTSEKKNNYASFNKTLTATAPGGNKGETFEMRFYLYSGVQLQTTYVYEWKEV
ncbi:MAG: hypothetical protein ACOWWO_18115 [Peptococcaceae bacterium]